MQLLNEEPSEGFSSYDWRYAMWLNILTAGESYAFIDRGGADGGTKRAPVRLNWMFDPAQVQRKRENHLFSYEYSDGMNSPSRTWTPGNVIDLAWMRTRDGLRSVSPYAMHRDTFNLAFAFSGYQAKFAKTGGIPPFVLKARWDNKTAVKEGLRQFLTAIRLANKRGDLVVPIGKDMEVGPLGINPEQGKILESQQFIVRQICRIFNLPPIYLHDLDRMTFANAEHQALNLAKYTISRWANQFEKQLTLKLGGGNLVVRHDLDELLRGDYVSRIQGHSTAILSGQMTPNEARAYEDRDSMDDGDDLFMQSGTVPISVSKTMGWQDGKKGISNNNKPGNPPG